MGSVKRNQLKLTSYNRIAVVRRGRGIHFMQYNKQVIDMITNVGKKVSIYIQGIICRRAHTHTDALKSSTQMYSATVQIKRDPMESLVSYM